MHLVQAYHAVTTLTRVRQDVVQAAVENLQAGGMRRFTWSFELLTIRFLIDLPNKRLRAVSVVEVDVKNDDTFDVMSEMC